MITIIKNLFLRKKLKLSGPPICKFCGLSSYSNHSDHLSIFFNVDDFLLWKNCFYFKFYCWQPWWPLLYLYSFRNYFRSDHFLAINEFKSFTILIILSPVSTFMLSKRVKIFVSVCRNFFRSLPKPAFSMSCLIFSYLPEQIQVLSADL